MRQLIITPATGKKLIGRATAGHASVKRALQGGRIVIMAGTTNGFVAEEVLKSINQQEGFSRDRFVRGMTLPPGKSKKGFIGAGDFPGDVVIDNGQWVPGKTIFDVLPELREGDVVIKGANALNLENRQAGVLVGHPEAGTVGAALQAVVGRRVELLLPVGLEKRIAMDLHQAARLLNAPGASGPRMFAVPGGEVITEIEALSMLTSVQAELTAAGGVGGAEGAVWLTVCGKEEDEKAAEDLVENV